MSGFASFRYDGKRALVVGGASGMGAATARLALDAGADVVVMDHAPVDLDGVATIPVNLAEQASVDAAVLAVAGPVDVVFGCAGVADGTPGIECINFIGHRHLIAQLIDRGWLGRGGAVGLISSAAGLGWEAELDLLRELLAIDDWDEAVAWVVEQGKADYLSMKRAMCAYVASQARPMLTRGIRINAICPGPTDTPLARANKDLWLGFGSDFRADVGIGPSTPDEQAYPLLFLCSDAASGINGQTLVSDAGYLASGLSRDYEPARGPAEFLYGRLG